MAENTDITNAIGAQPFHPTPDRRALVAAGPALALLATGATVFASEPVHAASIDHAIVVYRAASARVAAFDNSVWSPANEGWVARCEASGLDRNGAEASRLKTDLGLDEIEAEYARIEKATVQAMVALERFPARTPAELAKKIEFIEETGGRHEAEVLLADLRRIEGARALV